jgi:hypothetical protein
MAVAELRTKTRGPEVLAKHDGPCKRCPDPIRRGQDYICVVDGVGVMHAICAADYCRILEEHAEGGEE